MIYPDYCRQEMQKCLDTYLTFDRDVLPPIFEYSGITKQSPDYNVDTFLKLYDEETRRMSQRDFVRLLTEIKNTGLLSEQAITVINKLIGDRKIFKKIRFCADGSYRNNRIWGHADEWEYRIEPSIGYELWKQFDREYPVNTSNVKAYINWLYNHFDTIFLQIPCDARFISSAIEWEIIDKEFDDAYEDYYPDDCFDE